MHRPENELKALRPEIFTDLDKAGYLESFQNEVLRPILKMQHELLIEEAKLNPLLKRCFQLTSHSDQRKAIKQFFSKNPSTKYALIGMVLGCMKKDEFSNYWKYKSNFNQRLTNMIIERLMDGMS